MAIPGWTWGEDTYDGLAVESMADASATFAVLADETRLEILAALAARSPLSYSDLQAATGVTDNGRLNYHLRKLQPALVTEDGNGYALTARGRAVVDTALPNR